MSEKIVNELKLAVTGAIASIEDLTENEVQTAAEAACIQASILSFAHSIALALFTVDAIPDIDAFLLECGMDESDVAVTALSRKISEEPESEH